MTSHHSVSPAYAGQVFSRARLEQLISWMLTLLVFCIPFQKRHADFLKSFAYSLVPSDLALPHCFSKKIGFHLSDLVILSIVGLCLYAFRKQWKQMFFQGSSLCLIGFLAVCFISISCSVTKNYLLQYIRVVQFSLFVLLYCCVTHFFQQTNRQELFKKIAWAFLIAALLQCGIGILQYFLQSPIGLKVLGEVNMRRFGFPMEGGRRWIFDLAPRGVNTLSRCSGTFTHPNVLGCFLFVSLLWTYYLNKREERQIFFHLAAALQVFTLAITFSRSAFLAIALAIVILLVFSPTKRSLLLTATICLAALGSLVLLYDQFFARGGIVNYNAITIHADTERVIYHDMAWKMFTNHPLLGVGFNNFQIYSAPADLSGELFAKVHNIYLLILAETGILGGLCFFLFLLSNCKKALATKKEFNMIVPLIVGILWVGCCDYYLLNTQQGMLILFFAMALCSSTPIFSRQNR